MFMGKQRKSTQPSRQNHLWPPASCGHSTALQWRKEGDPKWIAAHITHHCVFNAVILLQREPRSLRAERSQVDEWFFFAALQLPITVSTQPSKAFWVYNLRRCKNKMWTMVFFICTDMNKEASWTSLRQTHPQLNGNKNWLVKLLPWQHSNV